MGRNTPRLERSCWVDRNERQRNLPWPLPLDIQVHTAVEELTGLPDLQPQPQQHLSLSAGHTLARATQHSNWLGI